MSGYEVTVSITALCVCCGKELPSSSYLTESRQSEGVFDRDNPHERKDRRVFITPCATCFAPRAYVETLIDAAEETVDDHDCGAVWGHQIEKLRAAVARAKGGAA